MGKYYYRERVRFSEVDETGHMTPYALLNNLQDCATFHSEDSGIGMMRNRELSQAWVITDMQLKILAYPKYNQDISTATWTTRFRGPVGHRCFEITGSDGELLAAAHSEWVFMDLAHQVPMNVPKEQEAYGLNPDLDITVQTGKRKVRPKGTWEEKNSFPAVWEYLDTNGHVNNAQYVRLARNYLPEGREIQGLRAEWKKSAMLHDILVPWVQTEDDSFFVQFTDGENGDIFFVCEMTCQEVHPDDSADGELRN